MTCTARYAQRHATKRSQSANLDIVEKKGIFFLQLYVLGTLFATITYYSRDDIFLLKILVPKFLLPAAWSPCHSSHVINASSHSNRISIYNSSFITNHLPNYHKPSTPQYVLHMPCISIEYFSEVRLEPLFSLPSSSAPPTSSRCIIFFLFKICGTKGFVFHMPRYTTIVIIIRKSCYYVRNPILAPLCYVLGFLSSLSAVERT
jgi:hypothetical protein